MSSIPNLWICYSLNLILSKGWRSKRQLPLHGQWIFSALSETRSDHVIRTRQIKPNPCILLPYRRDNTASALSKPFMNLSTSVRRKLDSRSLLGWILFMPEGTNFQEVTESVRFCTYTCVIHACTLIHHRSDHDASKMPIYPFPEWF